MIGTVLIGVVGVVAGVYMLRGKAQTHIGDIAKTTYAWFYIIGAIGFVVVVFFYVLILLISLTQAVHG